MRNYLHSITAIIIAAIVLCGAAIYNGYPLFIADTGAYLTNFHIHYFLPADRTITYSVFLYLASFNYSLWLAIAGQTLLLSAMLYLFFRLFYNKPKAPAAFVVLTLLLTAFTNVSWYVSQVSPDIFIPLTFLASVVYIFDKDVRIKSFCALLVFISVLMHNSNFLITFLFFGALLLASFIWPALKAKRTPLKHLFSISVAGLSLLCTLHWAAGYGFKPSKASHVFLIGKLCENGLLKKYLDENCSQTNYKLCQFKDELPTHAWAFVWEENGPFQKTGGWQNSATEYNAIINGMLTSPKYIWLNVIESVKATFGQLLLINAGDGQAPFEQGSSQFKRLQTYYPYEANTYLNSKQCNAHLNFDLFNSLYFYFIVLSSCLCIGIMIFVKMPAHEYFKQLYAITLLFILTNAFVTASFANISCRLNARDIWLLPLINILLLVCCWVKDKQPLSEL